MLVSSGHSPLSLHDALPISADEMRLCRYLSSAVDEALVGAEPQAEQRGEGEQQHERGGGGVDRQGRTERQAARDQVARSEERRVGKEGRERGEAEERKREAR